ncbi:MAG TPA: dephospho-CoA kinase [Candidatus Limnocylindria bacterium]|nr:dephospho-CoA kinase [Candidatus Limnocylindria bacterium]
MPTERPRRSLAADGLFILGLVGRAGSGKSTVARALAAGGAVVIEADRIGHEVAEHDPGVRRALQAEYGEDVYRTDGSLDRRRVAARVFTDRAARTRLDQLVHPMIVERIEGELGRLRDAGHRGVVVVDAALMLDWGLERSCDAVLAVTAPEEQQIARMMRARGWTRDEARARLEAQPSNDAFRAAADVTLENQGSVEELELAARAAVARWLAQRGAAARPS